MGAAVDQVAKEHDGGLGAAAGFAVRFDHAQKRIEQVEPAVDVAHHIGAPTGGTARVILAKGGNPAQHSDTSGKLASINLLTNFPDRLEEADRLPV